MTDQTKPAAPPRAHSSPTPLDLAARTVHRDAATGADTAPEEQSGRAGDAATQNAPADPGAVVNGAAANAGGGLPGANGAANGTGASPASAGPGAAGRAAAGPGPAGRAPAGPGPAGRAPAGPGPAAPARLAPPLPPLPPLPPPPARRGSG